jgi:PAS domain S-box-containing protein
MMKAMMHTYDPSALDEGLPGDPIRVLLVEDDDDDFVLVRDMLAEIASAKYRLDWVTQFPAALEQMKQSRHDIYLLDYRLGQYNGLDLAREAVAAGCRGPIIFLTGHEDRQVDIDAMRAGVADYLLKTQINGPLLERSIRYAIRQKQIETALQAERNRLKSIYDAMPDGLFILNAAHEIEYVNPALEREFGSDIGRTCYEYLHDRTSPCPGCKGGAVIAGDGPMSWEFRIEKTGKTYDILYTPMKDPGGTVSILGIVHDITERKKAEEKARDATRRLKHLSAELLVAQEKERQRIARELHDSIAASMTGIKFKIESLLYESVLQPAAVESLKLLSVRLQQAVEETRRIMADLRPSVLDDLGILAATKWFCREFTKTYTRIHIDEFIQFEEQDIPDEIKTPIFRIFQEALNNIAKHSKADLVRFSLKKSEGRIELVVEDNGRGFDPERPPRKHTGTEGLGLASMAERAELSGGLFSIESTPGKGTTIRASWPLE